MASQDPKSAFSASPPRPTLQLARSITELSPSKPALSRKHRHHHPHLHRREKDERISPFSPAPNLTLTNSHILAETRSEGVTPAGSRNGSGRNSIMAGDGSGTGSGNGNGEGWMLAGTGIGMGNAVKRRAVKDGEVREEKEKAVLRATELRNSLLEINTLSNDATRRLDNTYYSILEKFSVLHNTISSMKELALLARKLNEDFNAGAKDVLDQVETQMDTFNGFQEQDEKIEKLVDRIKGGRKRVKELGDRLEAVRARVEGWEKYEGERKEKTKTRLRVLWLGIGLLVLVSVTLIMLPYLSMGKTAELMHSVNSSNISASIPSIESMEAYAEEEVAKLAESAVKAVEELRDAHPRNRPVEDDPRLRLFDEL